MVRGCVFEVPVQELAATLSFTVIPNSRGTAKRVVTSLDTSLEIHMVPTLIVPLDILSILITLMGLVLLMDSHHDNTFGLLLLDILKLMIMAPVHVAVLHVEPPFLHM